MELTEEGLIKSINVPYSSNNAKNAANNAVAPQRKANPRDFLTEEILMASSTAKMAELVAKEIYNIRESKTHYCADKQIICLRTAHNSKSCSTT